jgi:purine-nucleoside phosphorylase
MPTPHISSNIEDIAKTVLMPGDPLRAKFIAETFLKDVKLVNQVRNMLAYTGTYNGKKVTVMGSGMGMPSIGIYSYELFKFYDVENIIRIGSCGAYDKNLKLFDVLLVSQAFSESSFAKTMGISNRHVLPASKTLNNRIKRAATKLNKPLKEGIIHSSDVFYRLNHQAYVDIYKKHQTIAVEMESFALFANAKALNRKAACLLTVSDSLVNHEETTSEQREKAFTNMMEIALKSI